MIDSAEKKLVKPVRKMPSFVGAILLVVLVVGLAVANYSYNEVRLRRDYQKWVKWWEWNKEESERKRRANVKAGHPSPVSQREIDRMYSTPPFSEWRHTKQARERLTPGDM